MARYIDLDKAIERIEGSPAFPNMGMDGYFLRDVVCDLLKKQPAADVAPKSEGEWVDQYQGKYDNQLYKCSECGETAFHDEIRWFLTHYCPNCGSKMKGGAE